MKKYVVLSVVLSVANYILLVLKTLQMHAHSSVETNYLCMESARIFEANVMAEKVEIYCVTTAVFCVLAVVLRILFF